MAKDRQTVAKALADWHFEVEPELTTIFWVNPNDDSREAPICLLEVTGSNQPPAQLNPGAVTAFNFSSTHDTPFPSSVAEVTPAELRLLQLGLLASPTGWNVDLESAREFPRPDSSRGQK
ncbi:MAG TPA: hypothetical protein VIV60_31365 [Polyangiaceae bacterium]